MSSAGTRSVTPPISRSNESAGRPSRTKATSVLVPPMSKVAMASNPAPAGDPRRAGHARAGAGQRGAHGHAGRLVHRHGAAVGLVDVRPGGNAERGHPLPERAHVGAHPGRQVGVGHGGGQALVLAELRMHLVRGHDGQPGKARARTLQRLPLVVRRDEGVEEADGEGLDGPAVGVRGDGGERAVQVTQVERRAHGAVHHEPLGHLVAAMTGHEGHGLPRVQVVERRTLLPGDLEEVAEALGGDERGARALRSRSALVATVVP